MSSNVQPDQQVTTNSFMARIGRRNLILISAFIIVLVVIATLISQMIAWNEADERLVHQSAFTGNLTVISQAGPYFKAFGTV